MGQAVGGSDQGEAQTEQYQFQDGTYVEYSRRTASFTMPKHHFHGEYEIYYLLSGSRYYFIQDNTYYIRAGDLVLIDRNQIHRTLETMENTHERILIQAGVHMLQDMDGSWRSLLRELFEGGSMILSFDERGQTAVRAIADEILAEIRQQRAGFPIVVKGLIAQLLAFALRNKEQRKDAEDSLKSANKRVFEILDYLNQEYAGPLTLSGVAQQFYISKFYLSHAFKDVTGFTFVEYLNHVRIKEAQRLLTKTSLPVARISEQSGFESVTHFGRVFKKISKMSPLQYRKQIKNAAPPP